MVALTLLERANAIFTSEKEREVLKPAALEAYVIGNKPDEAFALAADMLAKNPDDIQVLTRMTQVGTEEASRKNRKYANISLQYGLKAIALLEGNTKPASVADEVWTMQRGKLDRLYQQTAILYLAVGNAQEAKARLTKATTLSPRDPSNYALLARVINVDYLTQKNAYEAMQDVKSKQEAQQNFEALLDSNRCIRARGGPGHRARRVSIVTAIGDSRSDDLLQDQT